MVGSSAVPLGASTEPILERETHAVLVIVMATPLAECLRRLEADTTRDQAGRVGAMAGARAWWAAYEPSRTGRCVDVEDG